MDLLSSLKYKFIIIGKTKFRFFFEINRRTAANILYLFFIRGGNILIQLILIPISIQFVTAPSYGLWLTVSVMVGWLSILDLGISSALRNILATAILNNENGLAKRMISTSYAYLFLIAVAGFFVCYFLINILDWQFILDIPANITLIEFKKILLVIFSSFFLTLILKPIISLAYATHKAYVEFLILFVSNALNLIILGILLHLTRDGDLFTFVYLSCLSPLLVTLFLSLFFYGTAFKEYKPSIRRIDFSCSSTLVSISWKFMVIQIAALVVMQSNVFIIAHFLGNEEVTQYNIAQRYFNIPFTAMGMILVPYWTIFTEAHSRKELQLLKMTMNKLIGIASFLSLGCILMLIFSQYVYKIWLNEVVVIPTQLSITTCLFTILLIYGSVYATFVNGTGKIQLHMLSSIISGLLHVPLAILAIKYLRIEAPGLIALSSFWILLSISLRHIQYKQLLNFRENRSFWFS